MLDRKRIGMHEDIRVELLQIQVQMRSSRTIEGLNGAIWVAIFSGRRWFWLQALGEYGCAKVRSSVTSVREWLPGNVEGAESYWWLRMWIRLKPSNRGSRLLVLFCSYCIAAAVKQLLGLPVVP